MNFLDRRYIEDHDKLLLQYLAEHEAEWRQLKGWSRLIARLRLERRAWKYASENVQVQDRNDSPTRW